MSAWASGPDVKVWAERIDRGLMRMAALTRRELASRLAPELTGGRS